MSKQMILNIFDVEHGACAMLTSYQAGISGRLAMIDSGDNGTTGWRPSSHIKYQLGRTQLDYLIVTNADQDHLSDLEGLWDESIFVASLTRNRQVSPEALRTIKLENGNLTPDIERFLAIHASYTLPTSIPFNDCMGGITMSTFSNGYPEFADTNNLSLVAFIKFGNFKILFPGDMERAGWLKLLEQPAFRAELVGTNILVASHHGRENGYCEEIFRHFTPDAVVISDKPIAHETQLTVPDYRRVIRPNGVIVSTTNARRHVLTTRRDGHITFVVNELGGYDIYTEAGNGNLAQAA